MHLSLLWRNPAWGFQKQSIHFSGKSDQKFRFPYPGDRQLRLLFKILFSYCDARQKLDPLLPQSALSGYGSWTSRSVEVLECDVLKWRNGLSDLLTDEKGQQAFAKFLKSEYSGENLSFWLHTRRYRRAPSKRSSIHIDVGDKMPYFVSNSEAVISLKP